VTERSKKDLRKRDERSRAKLLGEKEGGRNVKCTAEGRERERERESLKDQLFTVKFFKMLSTWVYVRGCIKI
jgi:hypothetical protein